MSDEVITLDLEGCCVLHSLLPAMKTVFMFIRLIFLAFPLVSPEGTKSESIKGVTPSCLVTLQ